MNLTPKNQNVLYGLDKYFYELKDLYNGDLEEVIDYLSMNSSLNIEVVGFTDDLGSIDYNKQLLHLLALHVF